MRSADSHNWPAMNEVFEDHVHALLVNPRDPEGLAQAVIALLTNKELAKTIAHNGAALVEQKFSREVRARKLTNYFVKAMNSGEHRRHGVYSFAWLFAFLVLCVVFPVVVMMHRFYEASRSHFAGRV